MGNDKKASNEVKTEVRDLADIIAKSISHKGEGEFDMGDAYSKSLEAANIDEKTVKKVQKHNSDFVAAATLALGEEGFELMKSNKDIERVHAKTRLGTDTLSLAFDRKQEVPGKGEEKVVVYGVSNASYTVAASGNKGNLKTVREHLTGLATKAFS